MSKEKVSERGRSPGSAATQFKKGAPSPNKKGRPSGSKNRHTTIRKVLGELVAAKFGGKRRKITVTEAALRRLTQKALDGDNHAIRGVLQLWEETEDAMNAALEAEYPFSDADRQVIADIHARMKACEETSGS